MSPIVDSVERWILPMALLNLIIWRCALYEMDIYLHTNLHQVCFLPWLIIFHLRLSFSKWREFMPDRLYFCIFSLISGDSHYFDFWTSAPHIHVRYQRVYNSSKTCPAKFLCVILFAINCSVSISVGTLAFTPRLKSCKVLYVHVCAFHIRVVLWNGVPTEVHCERILKTLQKG